MKLEPPTFVVTEEGYEVTISDEVNNFILDYIELFSLGEQFRFTPGLNVELENTIITRLVMANFIKADYIEGFKPNSYTKITIKLPDRSLHLSAGLVNVDDKHTEIVYGIVY